MSLRRHASWLVRDSTPSSAPAAPLPVRPERPVGCASGRTTRGWRVRRTHGCSIPGDERGALEQRRRDDQAVGGIPVKRAKLSGLDGNGRRERQQFDPEARAPAPATRAAPGRARFVPGRGRRPPRSNTRRARRSGPPPRSRPGRDGRPSRARSPTRSRRACRARSPVQVPVVEDRPDEVAAEGDAAAQRGRRRAARGHHPGYRASALGDHDRFAGVRHAVQQGETAGLERACRNRPLGLRHDHIM